MIKPMQRTTIILVGALIVAVVLAAPAFAVDYQCPPDYVFSNAAYSIASAGDVNSDGVPDIVVGYPFDDSVAVDAGRATVYSGLDGSILWEFAGTFGGDALGWAVDGAGDVDNDGFDDVIIGAPSSDVPGVNSGAGFVYSGRTGVLLHTFHQSGIHNGMGRAVAGIGDIDGDGFDDCVTTTTIFKGGAYVWSGQTGGLLYSFMGCCSGGRYGYAASGIGDLDGDSYPEFMISESRIANPGFGSGKVYVYSGNTGTVLHTFANTTPNGEFGFSVGNAGDVSGDGIDDVIVGRYYGSAPYGSAFVYNGATGGPIYTLTESPTFSAEFGTWVSGAGDVDNDGRADVIVGDPGGVGYALVFSGLTGNVLFTYRGYSGGSRFGQCVAGAGDLDNNGYDDLLVASYGSSNGFTFLMDADADGDNFIASCDCDEGDAMINPATQWYRDLDGDGFGQGFVLTQCAQPPGYVLDNTDCDDTDAGINPNTLWYEDADGDGFGDAAVSLTQCSPPGGYVLDNTDCDDTDAGINPNTIWYEDADSDGFGNAVLTLTQCSQPSGYVLNDLDCDDTDAGINPNTVWFEDSDSDGYGNAGVNVTQCTQPSGYVLDNTDCDDTDSGINPNTTWYEDADSDGFGDVTVLLTQCVQPGGYVRDDQDCDDTDAGINPNTVWYADVDSDGFGDAASTLTQCVQPAGYVLDDQDCDDTDSGISPNTVWHEDSDSDGFGSATVTLTQCTQPGGYVLDDLDCDDTDANINPNTLWYRDSDGDGFGDLAFSVTQCLQPAGYVLDDTDCDDGLASIHPGAAQACNGQDNDCDGATDQLCPSQGDFDEDAFLTSLDLSSMIDILFAGQPDVKDAGCISPRGDFDCDGFSTSLDLGDLIDHLFAGGDGPCDPCNP